MRKIIHLIIIVSLLTLLPAATPMLTRAQSKASLPQGGKKQKVSLLDAIQNISHGQKTYTIDILSDGLQDLTTSASVTGLTAPEAVKRLCKGLPVKVKVNGRRITVQYDKRREVRKLKLNGEVRDIRAHKPLIGATVELLDADSTVLQQAVAKHHWWGSGEDGKVYEGETSEFSFTVPALPAKYIFRISFVGHRTAYVDYKLERVGRREHERSLPPLYLAPVSTMLPEVPVTASRVKFYYKGDTIIYNADAFILAEGSMLDALISQLPGVELKRDGRIYHEGKFVDDLLLNGKQFFSKDRKLMLENLPAYTVKDIAIYDKQTDENEWLGIKDLQTQRHVIDVRLKKEYMIGWIANAEVGGGTGDRYLARLFAMRHSDFSRLAIVANANNLDDDSQPGESDNWQRAGNALRRTERADLSFLVSDRNRRWEYRGDASVNHQRTEGETRTVRQNFLPSGDLYDHSFSNSRNEDLRLSSYHDFYRNHKSVRWHISPNVKYHHFNHSSDFASATFNAPVADVNRQLLDELFSPNASRVNLRDTLVNRILRQGLGRGHALEGTFNTGATVKIPHSNENLRLGATFSYSDRDEHLFNRQSVEYGAKSSQPPTHQHHFTDNHPDCNGTIQATVGYNIPLGVGWRSIHATYYFTHNWRHRRSSLYLLDRLNEEPAAIDDLPSMTDYQQVMDSTNTFDSRMRENSHRLDVNLGYKFNKAKYGQIWTLLNGNITLHQQHLDYQRGIIDTTLCRTAVSITLDDNTYLDFKNGQIGMTMGIRQTLPALEQRIDLRDDTDPMNVRLGNIRLHPSVTPDFGVSGSYRFKRGYHYMEWHQKRTFNAIAMGCTYDTRTGARTYRPENVNGNYTTDAGYTFHCALDSTKKLNLDLPFHVTHSQSVDLVGTAANDAAMSSSPQRSKVKRLAISMLPSFKADIGRHHFDLICQPVWERLSSDRQDFQDFSAFTCRTSLAAILKLPWKLDLSTDLSLYSRTGYADEALNTNDLVWNVRLSRPFFKGKLLVVFDGFDLLGQLSNVTRTLNAQGRTETWTNVMPRYALLHVVYRLNKQPKKQ